MSIPEILSSQSLIVPEWIKNNARWWADGIITENDFVNGLKYMVEKGIIQIN